MDEASAPWSEKQTTVPQLEPVFSTSHLLFQDTLPSTPILVFYCFVTDCHKFSNLKTSIILWQFVGQESVYGFTASLAQSPLGCYFPLEAHLGKKPLPDSLRLLAALTSLQLYQGVGLGRVPFFAGFDWRLALRS